MVEINGHYFDWDDDKNLSNIEKHGIPFKIAATAFFDEDAVIFEDIKHSVDEDRFMLIGFSKKHKLLTVCHCYRGNDSEIVRIISARNATKSEKQIYGGAWE